MNNKDGNTAEKKPVLTRVERLVDEVFDSLDPMQYTKAGRSRRSPTLLKLEWLGERLRRAEHIKAQLIEGTYNVSSEAVAKKMLNLD
jgi:anti-sigma28 factor (negative regulator of flagellin synthesis)